MAFSEVNIVLISIYLQQNLINFLEVSIDYLLHAERYETVGEVSKLVIPFYERNRQFKVN